MDAQPLAFLKQLLDTPSPSGYEAAIQKVARNYLREFCDELGGDTHGNVWGCVNPRAATRVMLAGHCDQLGLLVTHVDDHGFIYTQTIGGWDPVQLVGQRMVVWTRSGPVPGVIARKAIHLLTDDERKAPIKAEDLWIDIGAKDRDEAAAAVRIGDPVTFQLGLQTLRNNLANAPAMDDKVGVWTVVEALRRADKSKLRCAAYAVSTVQEEIGLRGARTSAFNIDPRVGVAVDVTHASDTPNIDKRQNGDVALGAGPVLVRGPNMNPVVVERLIDLCGRRDIPYQLTAQGKAASNDSNAIQVNRGGVATAVVAIPNRYMHSAVETISLDDLEHAANLLAAFLESVGDEDDFTP